MYAVKICTNCIYSTRIAPEDGAAFYECGNPDYTVTNLVDGSKKYFPCEILRRPLPQGLICVYPACGPLADGYTPKVPEFTCEDLEIASEAYRRPAHDLTPLTGDEQIEISDSVWMKIRRQAMKLCRWRL